MGTAGVTGTLLNASCEPTIYVGPAGLSSVNADSRQNLPGVPPVHPLTGLPAGRYTPSKRTNLDAPTDRTTISPAASGQLAGGVQHDPVLLDRPLADEPLGVALRGGEAVRRQELADACASRPRASPPASRRASAGPGAPAATPCPRPWPPPPRGNPRPAGRARASLESMGRPRAFSASISAGREVGEQRVVLPHQLVGDRHHLAKRSPAAARRRRCSCRGSSTSSRRRPALRAAASSSPPAARGRRRA